MSRPRDRICVIARCDPRFLGRPFSCWSLSKLRDYLIDAGYVTTISIETIRRILHERGVSWQATKTWKASSDPDFTTKMSRILDLYDHPPADGRVLCVDEFGPQRVPDASSRRSTYYRAPHVRPSFHHFTDRPPRRTHTTVAAPSDSAPEGSAEKVASDPIPD